MDLHQQVGEKMIWDLFGENLGMREYIAQEVEMWVRESEGGDEKCSNVAKLQPLNYTDFEVAKTPKPTMYLISRWWRWKRHLKAVGSSSCV